MTTDELRTWVKENYVETKKLRELSATLKVSKSKLSLFVNGKYCGDEKSLVKAIEQLIKGRRLSRRDERRVLDIKTIINGADDPEAIYAELANSFNVD
jgi:hypothetical protein